MGGNHAVCCSFTGTGSSALQHGGVDRTQAQHPALCPGIPAGLRTKPAPPGRAVASRPFQERKMAGCPCPKGFGRIGALRRPIPTIWQAHTPQTRLASSDCAVPVSFRNQSRHAGLAHMVRIGSRKWTEAQIERLIVLIDAGSSAASAAIALKRSITVVQTKARSLGRPFHVAVSR
jgi:hypothetical protein